MVPLPSVIFHWGATPRATVSALLKKKGVFPVTVRHSDKDSQIQLFHRDRNAPRWDRQGATVSFSGPQCENKSCRP